MEDYDDYSEDFETNDDYEVDQCPYCSCDLSNGSPNTEDWSLTERQNTWCPECCEEIIVEPEVSITYRVYKANNE